jgi:hypothetical protein
MALIKTYVCDVSGKSGTNEEDYFEISITSRPSGKGSYYQTNVLKKLLHKDVAEKLHLVKVKEPENNPTPTLESQLLALLQEWKDSIVEEATESAIQSVRN